MYSIPRLLDFYVRVLVLILACTIGLAFVFAGAKKALAATLKNVTVLSGNTLTAGDLFEGLPADKAGYVLGPAPQPGQDMVLDARTLMRVALALNLSWKPAHSDEKVTVRREASVIDTADIRNDLALALEAKGLEGSYNMVLTGKPEILLPPDQPATFEITTLRFDPRKDIFEAVLAAPTAKNPLKELPVSGRIERLVSVPVLKNTLRAGDIIGTGDIAWIDLPSKDVQHDMALTEQALTGMTPRRVIEGGKPLREIDLARPQLVDRGETITIIYESGPMKLTSQGKALQNGAKGDIIRVVNTTSNRSVEGLISDDGQVTVSQ